MTDLTPRQMTVLRHAALGETEQDTARVLYNAIATIKGHRKAILRKLGARNMTHAVAIGMREGWLR